MTLRSNVSRRAKRSASRRHAPGSLPRLLVTALLTLGITGCNGAPTARFTAVPNPLVGRVGVYGMGSDSDSRAARNLGISYVVGTEPGGQPDPLDYVNSATKDAIYAAMCPRGISSCRPLSKSAEEAVLREVDAVAQRDAEDARVLGTYVVDDYWTDMSGLLEQAYAAIRKRHDKPVMCGVGANLADANGAISAATRQKVRNSLKNYSSRWCDGVFVYAYASPGRAQSSEFDWTMATLLPFVVEGLEQNGFDPATHALVGVPQAFRFHPRTETGRGPLLSAQYWAGPDAESLATQVDAYCSAGARGILAYTWDDGSIGRIAELHNAQDLRNGLRAGLSTCGLAQPTRGAASPRSAHLE